MRPRSSRILVIGTVVAVCWVLFVTQAVHSNEPLKLVAGVIGLFLVFSSTICLWMASVDRREDAHMRELIQRSGQSSVERLRRR